MRPWDYHPELTEDRLVKVAQLLAVGRGSAVDRFDPTIGDDSLDLGCVRIQLWLLPDRSGSRNSRLRMAGGY